MFSINSFPMKRPRPAPCLLVALEPLLYFCVIRVNSSSETPPPLSVKLIVSMSVSISPFTNISVDAYLYEL